MSLAWVLREIQCFKLYYSWDSFTDTHCAESQENNLEQPESFCLEIHICLGRYICVTDVNQDFKCRRLFAGPFECFQCVFFCVSVLLHVGNLLSFLTEFLQNKQSCHWPYCPFSSPVVIQANKSWTIWVESWKCSCQSLGLWPQTDFI